MSHTHCVMNHTTNTPAAEPRTMMSAHVHMKDAANPAVQATLADRAARYLDKAPACPENLRGAAREVLLLFTRLVQDGKGGTSWDVVCLLAAALLYLLCPLDAVPDVIPIAGWADDAAVLLYALRVVTARCADQKTNETQR